MPDCHVARVFSEKSETKNLITTKGPRRLELFQEKCKNGLTLGGTVDSYEMHVNFWIRFNRTFNVWEQFTFYTVSVPQTMISGHALVVLVGPTWSWAYFLEDNFEQSSSFCHSYRHFSLPETNGRGLKSSFWEHGVCGGTWNLSRKWKYCIYSTGESNQMFSAALWISFDS